MPCFGEDTLQGMLGNIGPQWQQLDFTMSLYFFDRYENCPHDYTSLRMLMLDGNPERDRTCLSGGLDVRGLWLKIRQARVGSDPKFLPPIRPLSTEEGQPSV